MAFNMLHRRCAGLALNTDIEVSVYPQEDIKVLNTITFEVDLLAKNNTGKVAGKGMQLTYSPLMWMPINSLLS